MPANVSKVSGGLLNWVEVYSHGQLNCPVSSQFQKSTRRGEFFGREWHFTKTPPKQRHAASVCTHSHFSAKSQRYVNRSTVAARINYRLTVLYGPNFDGASYELTNNKVKGILANIKP